MKLKTYGIHHVSTIAQHPQENVEFYTGFLGLRLVKQTLNYEDSMMYHFYYGNHNASENISTFFPIPSADEGKVGTGQVAYQSYAVPKGSFNFWEKRLQAFNIPYYKMNRFGNWYLIFSDPHGYELELVETDMMGIENKWEYNGVTHDVSLQGILSAGLFSSNMLETDKLLTEILGYELIDENEEYRRYRIGNYLGGYLELRKSQIEPGQRGYGTAHHIALKIDDNAVEAWYQYLEENGYNPTKPRNRRYFQAIYFRDRGGILFELSTKSPGMMLDESEEELGKSFIIPQHFLDQTNEILKRIVPIEVRPIERLTTYSYRTLNEYEFVKRRQNILEQINKIKAKDTLNANDEKELESLREAFKQSRKEHL